MSPRSEQDLTISIVVPAYNEAEVIAEFNERLSRVRAKLRQKSEVVYVNDGSRDETLAALRMLCECDPTISVVNLSRNFGKEIALTAGLDHSSGDAIIVIDADLQDPPELIPTLIERWRQDEPDVVYAQRRSRAGDSWLKKITAYSFYRILNKLSGQPVPVDTGDFRLLSRRAVGAITLLREQHRFMKGLFAWIGFRQVAIEYDRDPRSAGKTKWNYLKLLNLSLEGITSFSMAPLRAASYIGLIAAAGSVVYGLIIIGRTIIFGNPVAGYPSLLVVILFLGGAQLLSLGIIGEYVGRVFNETKGRPLYLVDSLMRAKPARPNGEPVAGRNPTEAPAAALSRQPVMAEDQDGSPAVGSCSVGTRASGA